MHIEENIPLAPMTTMKIGGPARYFCTATSDVEVAEGVAYAKKKQLPLFVLGGGSNLLVSDKGYSGLVMRIAMKSVTATEEGSAIVITAGAGGIWDDLVLFAVEHGAWGIENLSAIPGTVGGGVVQNIGAYGCEVKDTIVSVDVFDPKLGRLRTLQNNECHFGYRESIWKGEGRDLIVLGATFRLNKAGKPNIAYKDLGAFFLSRGNITPTLRDIRDAVRVIRAGKFPDLKILGTAGSFFKNPVVSSAVAEEFLRQYPLAPHHEAPGGNIKLSAAWIIDNILHMRGVRIGNVGCFREQALVIVNHGGASCDELKKFIEHIQERVHEVTAITLTPEVVLVDE